jgi:hypothetical protein
VEVDAAEAEEILALHHLRVVAKVTARDPILEQLTQGAQVVQADLRLGRIASLMESQAREDGSQLVVVVPKMAVPQLGIGPAILFPLPRQALEAQQIQAAPSHRPPVSAALQRIEPI